MTEEYFVKGFSFFQSDKSADFETLTSQNMTKQGWLVGNKSIMNAFKPC